MMTARAYLTATDLGMAREDIKRSLAQHIEYTLGKDEYSVTARDFFKAVAYASRDRMFDRWNKTQQRHHKDDARRVYYMSLEYLVGRILNDSLHNLGIFDAAGMALRELDVSLDDVAKLEDDPGLGNGGLGRLAACFLDSMATLSLPAIGYGICYEYGIFRQEIEGGAQLEQPDNWRRYGTPWLVPRPEQLFIVRFGGRVQTSTEKNGRVVYEWVDTDNIVAIPNDLPIPGHRNEAVNTLRLWSAHASRELDISSFNHGDYIQAVQEKNASENLSRVLYPNDQTAAGYELRLKQENFFVSATLQDAFRRHRDGHPSLENLPEKAVFQLNDTHPALGVAEMMRLLIDDYGMGWDAAWSITIRCFAYTNHTVMPEALETWSVSMFARVLPRHLLIINEINRRFLDEVRARFPGDDDLIRRVSLFDEGPPQKVRMAHLAIVGSFAVNGVSALHSRLLRDKLFADFARIWPNKFTNETNGISPRRWLRTCNPALSSLITAQIGEKWTTRLEELERLLPLADDGSFRSAFREAKRMNKQRLAAQIRAVTGIVIDERSLFDVQIKRMHEYKRQLLNVLSVVATYLDLKSNKSREGRAPRTVIFGGKAAPGYETAKRIIRLIHDVGAVVNGDPETRDWLKVVFYPNYSVSAAEVLIPAADLSEQISTAGTEASGTGNMKLSLNGALTIGTLDGANVEILEAVGAENIFIFGLNEAEVSDWKSRGYDPLVPFRTNPVLQSVLAMIATGGFSPGEPLRYRGIVDSLLYGGDRYFVCADFESYRQAQQRVEQEFLRPEDWSRKAILNVAKMGRFSSDSTIRGYANDIWRIKPSYPRG
ncbi:MAG TPA: glycogen/starch/alpha-glucan phosphorylase [Polyangiaceae bacterium]